MSCDPDHRLQAVDVPLVVAHETPPSCKVRSRAIALVKTILGMHESNLTSALYIEGLHASAFKAGKLSSDDSAPAADFYRQVWNSGDAGTEIPVRVLREGRETWLRVTSADRESFLKRPQLQ